MPKPEIPPEVRRFVLTSIPSVPHIEALMLVRSNAPAGWTALEVAQRLYVTPAVATGVLADLCQAGMLRSEGPSPSYSYDTNTPQLRGVIDHLASLYGTHLVEITLLIHSKMDRKAQQFADAFDFRKEP